MDLLSVEIPKLKKLSTLEVKAPQKEETSVQPFTDTLRPSEEEVAYTTMIAKNPLLEELVASFDLVSCRTKERIKKLQKIQPRKKETRPQPGDSSQLSALALKIIDNENSYSMEEVIDRLREETKVTQERAERGFNLMVEAGVIEATTGGRYCLKGSTPF